VDLAIHSVGKAIHSLDFTIHSVDLAIHSVGKAIHSLDFTIHGVELARDRFVAFEESSQQFMAPVCRLSAKARKAARPRWPAKSTLG
jgi:hypothetical protein